MRARRCISERVAQPDGSYAYVWHIVPSGQGPDEDATFCPILCSDADGIVFPGPIRTREPSCPECVAAASKRGAA